MKVIIAGSRQIEDFDILKKIINDMDWNITEVVSGGCRGVDEMGEKWAKDNGVDIKIFHADWAKYGREAGELRNREMAEYADGLLLLWDGKSPGSSCMLRESAKANIKIFHQIYGMDLGDMEKSERELLNYYWQGKGRLIHDHGHWQWEVADKNAPMFNQSIVNALIEKGLLEAVELTILKSVRDKIHSKFA